MKVQFDGYEVEIKVKTTFESKASKRSAMALLNTIGILYREAAAHRKELLGREATYYTEAADEIYEALEAEGYFR